MTTTHTFDVAIIGGGSGGERVASIMASGSRTIPARRVVVFEPGLVGGECPFFACIPSKALLAESHRTFRPTWDQALEYRDTLTYHLDDSSHAQELTDLGVTVVRACAAIVGHGRVIADGIAYVAEHIVVATGAEPKRLDHTMAPPDVWTSADALSSRELPQSLVIIGGGPVGCELAEMYARFGVRVALVESSGVLLRDVDSTVSAALCVFSKISASRSCWE
jgi:pyruvate/2-oxoglutarate dehydrogenase complex dihydrolipoamide dehydrogenase (E3) component